VTKLRAALGGVIADERTWMGVFLLTATIATAICVVQQCNNFLIFRAAFDHVIAGTDLYAHHPAEHQDLFKYSPTFALFFAPFRALPYAPALLAWNLLNVVLIYLALRMALDPSERLAAIQLTGIGLVTTIDGTQSNGLVAALIVLAFAAMERRRIKLAALAVVAGTLIKLFPAAAVAFAVPRRERWRFGVALALILTAMVALPLLVTSAETLAAQYRSWYSMGAVDALDRGASVMRLLHDLFGYDGPNWPVQLAGTALLMLPLLRGQWSDPSHRRLFLASLLVYAVIFNHKAEQPSYIIAVVGVAIWYAVASKTTARTVLSGAVFVSTIPVFLEVAVPGLLGGIQGPLAMAAATCVLAWLGMQVELLDLVPAVGRAMAPAEMAQVTD
jgi:hypothetical protein